MLVLAKSGKKPLNLVKSTIPRYAHLQLNKNLTFLKGWLVGWLVGSNSHMMVFFH